MLKTRKKEQKKMYSMLILYFLWKTIAQKIFLVYNDSEEREVENYVDLFEIKQLFYLQQWSRIFDAC